MNTPTPPVPPRPGTGSPQENANRPSCSLSTQRARKPVTLAAVAAWRQPDLREQRLPWGQTIFPRFTAAAALRKRLVPHHELRAAAASPGGPPSLVGARCFARMPRIVFGVGR